jgi:1-acyl-sn-glycerol-3-phosphate acyltransferase
MVGATYRMGSALFRGSFRALGIDLRVDGLEHVPATGPGILASNHIGYLDFAFVMLSPPRPRREVRFLARADLYERWPVGPLMHRMRQIPVDAHGDPLTALRLAVAALERGELIGLHPEGTISPSFVPRKAASGAVRMAEATGAPIVPCAVWGSHRILTKWRPRGPVPRGVPVFVRYGEPYHPTQGSAIVRTRDLMDRIGALLESCWADDDLEPGAWWVPAHLGGGAMTPEAAEERLAAQRAERQARAKARREADA